MNFNYVNRIYNNFAWFSLNITLLLHTCYVLGWFVRCWLVWSQYTIPSWTWESGSTPVRGWVGSHLFWPRTEACCHVHWFSSQIKKWQRSLARTEKNRLRLWKPSWSKLIYVMLTAFIIWFFLSLKDSLSICLYLWIKIVFLSVF